MHAWYRSGSEADVRSREGCESTKHQRERNNEQINRPALSDYGVNGQAMPPPNLCFLNTFVLQALASAILSLRFARRS